MIEINLLPQPKKPDRDFQRILNPLITYLIDLSYDHATKTSDEAEILWGKAWAALLFLRKEILNPGFSPADEMCKKILLENKSLDELLDQ